MKSMSLRAFIAFAFLLSTFAAVPAFANHNDDGDHEFADSSFYDTWAYTDNPVAAGKTHRTWMWGPGPYTNGLMEAYSDSAGGERLVQYFDKSRMEINNADSDPYDLWYVTNGRLVAEMVEGKVQMGDGEYDHSLAPATNQIAGDYGHGPTYADINNWGLRAEAGVAPGSLANQTIDDDGDIDDSDHYGKYGVTAAYHIDTAGIDKTVASVFWNFMTSEGPVYEGNKHMEYGPIFENPFYATGYPITNPYWANVEVGGEDTDVLWQCFERRCLTYTPANKDAWKVEAGNVGLHYYNWRYIQNDFGETGPIVDDGDNGDTDNGDTDNGDTDNGDTDNGDGDNGDTDNGDGDNGNGDGDGSNGTDTVTIVVINPEGDGTIGCDDDLIEVEVDVDAYADIEAQLTAALDALLVAEIDGYYNVFTSGDTSLEVASIDLVDGVANVDLTGQLLLGGVCDDPRIEAQIAATLTQFAEVDDVVITIDGDLLDDILDQDDDGNGDSGNGADLPTDLGLDIVVDADALGNDVVDMTVTLDNQSDWSGDVTVEVSCEDGYADSGVVNLNAQGEAEIEFSNSSDGDLADVGVCTATALIGDDVIDTTTVVVADLL